MDHNENKKKMRLKKEVIYILISGVCLIIGGVGGYFLPHKSIVSKDKNVSIYDQVSSLISNQFVDTVETEDSITQRLLSGMISGLKDPHTSYLTSEQANTFNSDINGSFEGIGVTYTVIPYGALITEVFEGTPAKEAGLLSGDFITHVEGTSIEGYKSDKIQKMIRGKKDSQVKLKILRDGKEIEKTCNRKSIETSLQYHIIPSKKGNIGFVRINSFGDNSAQLLEKGLKEFEKENIKKICIDVRDNGGGYLDAAKDILNLLIPANQTMFQVQNKDEEDEVYKSNNGKKYEFEKGYILVDKETASASEVLTSALNEVLDYKVIGEKTYGKGTVQTQIPFTDGSILKMTIAKWITAKGNWVNAKGITPDYEVVDTRLSGFSANKLSKKYQYDQVDYNILNMQKQLKTLGYQVDREDGYFSKQTEVVLKKFESDYHLAVNGIYENKDAKILLNASMHKLLKMSEDPVYKKMLSL